MWSDYWLGLRAKGGANIVSLYMFYSTSKAAEVFLRAISNGNMAFRGQINLQPKFWVVKVNLWISSSVLVVKVVVVVVVAVSFIFIFIFFALDRCNFG